MVEIGIEEHFHAAVVSLASHGAGICQAEGSLFADVAETNEVLVIAEEIHPQDTALLAGREGKAASLQHGLVLVGSVALVVVFLTAMEHSLVETARQRQEAKGLTQSMREHDQGIRRDLIVEHVGTQRCPADHLVGKMHGGTARLEQNTHSSNGGVHVIQTRLGSSNQRAKGCQQKKSLQGHIHGSHAQKKFLISVISLQRYVFF